MKKKLISVAVMLCAVVFLYGCSNNNADVNYEDGSREYIEHISSPNHFGYGKTDISDVALQYIYESEYFNEEYGDDFTAKVVGGTDETNCFFITSFYEGTGRYLVQINDEDTWVFNLSKEYFGKWKVDNYELEGIN